MSSSCVMDRPSTTKHIGMFKGLWAKNLYNEFLNGNNSSKDFSVVHFRRIVYTCNILQPFVCMYVAQASASETEGTANMQWKGFTTLDIKKTNLYIKNTMLNIESP